ncbi:conserved hypothetical protein [Sporisorium reilianum SRZ2]|uniref:Uncharacterized protein n=1 Tax=Sporisorium reilianum (strain SRZ2) TaxID=999809 RepID=E7A0B9_SPORE|nr:conserved hypothetical protein [Sporisorium reilianum SRZ2]
MVKATTTSMNAWQHLYRALLRSSAASVRFCRPAARNTRRYLRDEFAGSLAADREAATSASSHDNGASSSNAIACDHATTSNAPLCSEQLRRQTHNTLAFHLSASLLRSSTSDRPWSAANTSAFEHADQTLAPLKRPRGTSTHTQHGQPHPPATDTLATPSTERDPRRQPTTATRLAHRVMANLSSLTYHHLSPHTQMQTRAHLKQNSARKPQKLSSLARVLGKIEADAGEPAQSSSSSVGLESAFGAGKGGDETLNALHMKLGFLMPSAKPARGPVSARLKEWDGQAADKIASEGSLRQMEADLATVERLLQQHDADAKQRGGAKQQQQPKLGKEAQQLKTEAEGLRRKIKSASKALAQAEAREQLESIAVGHLADLVGAAQDSEQVMLGKRRWMRRKSGEFLPP